MKKLLALLLFPIFLTSQHVISTEEEIDFEANQLFELSHPLGELTYFNEMPVNPVLVSETFVYTDEELTQISKTLSAETSLSVRQLFLNNQGLPVFQLDDGLYVSASRDLISDDVVLSERELSLEMWTKEGLVAYPTPPTAGVTQSPKAPEAYQKVKVVKQASTRAGIYYQLTDQTWISEEFLTIFDNRMEKIQKVLEADFNKADLAIYVKSMTSQQVATINADKLFYAASVAKLPTLYYAQEQLNKGKFTLNQALKYSKQVHNFRGSYDPEGSGDMSKSADDKDYSVETVLKAIAQQSDNAASNIAGYYLADQFSKDFYAEITAITGQKWDLESREATVTMAGRLMEAIYHQNGEIISYLSHTDFDNQRISKDIDVPVAHKIGDAYDFRHDVAIVYADEPFVLAIFSENASYDDITSIANKIYDILK